jgi:hypothetical protein
MGEHVIEDLMPFVIRSAVQADANAVFGLLAQFVVSYPAERAAFDRTFPELILSDSANLLVATDNDKVVGYALALRMMTLYANGDLWNLQELIVAPECGTRRGGEISGWGTVGAVLAVRCYI